MVIIKVIRERAVATIYFDGLTENTLYDDYRDRYFTKTSASVMSSERV